VKISGGDQGGTGPDLVAVGGLPHFERATFVKAFGKGAGKTGGICWTMQMPGNSAGRRVRTSLTASVPPVEAPMTSELAGRELCAGRVLRRPIGRGGWTQEGKAGTGRALDAVGQLFAQAANVPSGTLLGHHVDGAKFQSAQCKFGASLRKRADDDHRHGPVFLEDFEESQSVHARHLDIQGQHIGFQLQNHVARHIRVAGGAHHLNFRVLRQRVRNHSADDGGIVHDEHTNFFLEAHAIGYMFINWSTRS
jgi:hypothetical protein